MANLRTLAGITAEREVLYQRLRDGEVTEQKATIAEKILRGQQAITALQLQFIEIIGGAGNKRFEPFVVDAVNAVTVAINGPVALTEGSAKQH